MFQNHSLKWEMRIRTSNEVMAFMSFFFFFFYLRSHLHSHCLIFEFLSFILKDTYFNDSFEMFVNGLRRCCNFWKNIDVFFKQILKFIGIFPNLVTKKTLDLRTTFYFNILKLFGYVYWFFLILKLDFAILTVGLDNSYN